MKVCRYISLIMFLLCLLVGCKRNDPGYQGYVDARYTYVSSNVSGRLRKLLVESGDPIKEGQLLFVLDPEPESMQREEATFQVAQARDELRAKKAALSLAKTTLARYEALEKKKVIDIQTVDQSRTQVTQALAAWQGALDYLQDKEAALKQMNWLYEEKKIRALKQGVVFDTFYISGEIVPAKTPVLSMLSAEDIYVVFYVNARQLHRFHLHQQVSIVQFGKSPGIPAKITYISPTAEYTPPVIYSNETNDKLVFRIEATPVSPSLALHPGAPIEVKP